MRDVLDTSALYRPDALRRLQKHGRPIVLPAVAFTERARQLAAQGIPPERFLRYLSENDIQVERFGWPEALRHAVALADDATWRRLARDAMIAGHVRAGDRLWTANPRDFRVLGLRDEQIVDIAAGAR